jgi:hypothetical protein
MSTKQIQIVLKLVILSLTLQICCSTLEASVGREKVNEDALKRMRVQQLLNTPNFNRLAVDRIVQAISNLNRHRKFEQKNNKLGKDKSVHWYLRQGRQIKN